MSLNINVMTHVNSKTHVTINKNKGSALVIAIFILVVMTLLGSALVKMLSASAESVAFEVLGTRAFQAAQIGIEWELQKLFPLNSSAIACQSQAIINSNKPNLSTIDGLYSCRIEALTCSSFEVNSVTYYTVESTGQCDINGEVTSRTLQVQARSL